MPDVKFKLGLDNRIQPGQQTLDEIIATLEAAGETPSAANVIRDPITGKVLAVELSLPDTASAVAKAAIDANAGVATTTVALPEPLFTFDLDAANGIALTPTILESNQFIGVAAQLDGLGKGIGLGLLKGDGITNSYTDELTNSLGNLFTVITVVNGVIGTLTLPVGSLTINKDGVPVPIVQQNPIAVTLAAAFSSINSYYLDVDGKIYLALQIIDSFNTVVPNRTYAEAVAAGAV